LLSVTLAGTSALAASSAATPRMLGTNWVARHEVFVAEAKRGGVGLLFLGDSITAYWHTRGRTVWDKVYAPRHAANFGIAGDRTQNLLWRVDHGELDGIRPKVVVLLIGTNNTTPNSDGKPRNAVSETVEGITAIVNRVRAKLPESKVLLLGIFPRGAKDSRERLAVAEVNRAIAQLDDGRQVRFLDLTGKFLAADGALPKANMPDGLHPSPKGYQIWAEAMEPTLAAMFKD
jgi:lysophospholipase L1-like esterase